MVFIRIFPGIVHGNKCAFFSLKNNCQKPLRILPSFIKDHSKKYTEKNDNIIGMCKYYIIHSMYKKYIIEIFCKCGINLCVYSTFIEYNIIRDAPIDDNTKYFAVQDCLFHDYTFLTIQTIGSSSSVSNNISINNDGNPNNKNRIDIWHDRDSKLIGFLYEFQEESIYHGQNNNYFNDEELPITLDFLRLSEENIPFRLSEENIPFRLSEENIPYWNNENNTNKLWNSVLFIK
jgi:hypothetical protein